MKHAKSLLIGALFIIFSSFTPPTEMVQITWVSCSGAGTMSIAKSQLKTFVLQQTANCGFPPLIVVHEQ